MWTLQLHGLTDHLSADEARTAEEELLVKAHSLFAGLIPGGHQGVAGTFSGEHVGQVNLVDATAPPEGAPPTEGAVVADGTYEPPPTEPPPTFVNGEPAEPPGAAPDPQPGGE